MHLLVLSAFRQNRKGETVITIKSQCTFWCSVLSDVETALDATDSFESQCTFWCSVLSDKEDDQLSAMEEPVSMHLLVLSAFRRAECSLRDTPSSCLNAPFGAQCFPTENIKSACETWRAVSMHLLVLSAFRHRASRLATLPQYGLNAPFGAQCFPTRKGFDAISP